MRIQVLLSFLGVTALVAAGTSTASDSIFRVDTPKGLDFVLRNSPTPKKYLIETMPGGVALLDYNKDGLLDIFLVNGGRIPSPNGKLDFFSRHEPAYWNRLYRQNADGSFTDVTVQAGLANPATRIMAWASR